MNRLPQETVHSSEDARVCIWSQRYLDGLVSRCADFEFEDEICKLDGVDLYAPLRGPRHHTRRKISNRLARHAGIADLNPGASTVRINKDYELFFMKCLFLSDLLSLNALEGWRERSGIKVCWVVESWAGELHKFKGQLKILSQFDYVLLTCSASVEPIQDAIGRPCFYLPPGVNASLFCPYPDPPARSVDVYYLGRRSKLTHESLLRAARLQNLFYVYDTMDRLETSNSAQHRALLANIAKRSRYFFANSGKIDVPSETHRQREIGPRFFEGAAAGTVMLGDYPETNAFAANFDWPDAVIRVPYDAADIVQIIAELDSDPERIELIRTKNIVQSLLRHDWVYRWKQVLEIAGIHATPAVGQREMQLKKLAESIRTTVGRTWLPDEGPAPGGRTILSHPDQTSAGSPLAHSLRFQNGKG